MAEEHPNTNLHPHTCATHAGACSERAVAAKHNQLPHTTLKQLMPGFLLPNSPGWSVSCCSIAQNQKKSSPTPATCVVGVLMLKLEATNCLRSVKDWLLFLPCRLWLRGTEEPKTRRTLSVFFDGLPSDTPKKAAKPPYAISYFATTRMVHKQ